MSVAPGSILGWMAIRDLLKSRDALSGSFLDAGCGEGWFSYQLVKLGFREGLAIEPSEVAFSRAQARVGPLVNGSVKLLNCRLNQLESDSVFDLGCAFTVIEHIEDDVSFIRDLKSRIRSGGHVIVTVPAREDKWTLEDDLVGHLRRYTRDSLEAVMSAGGLIRGLEIVGMGFPLINFTEVARNEILRRKSAGKQRPSKSQQTAISGVWDSKWYNTFPRILGLLVNEYTLRPLDWIQKMFNKSPRCVMLIAIAQVD